MTPKLNIGGFTKEYLLGIPEIDEQHETFYNMLAKVGESVSDMYKPLDDDEVDALIDVMGQLRDYALIHFGTEESYMKEVGYPGLAEQKKEHNRFLSDVIRMEAELMNGSSIPAIRVHNFVHQWYREHILEHDKPLGEFYKNNKK